MVLFATIVLLIATIQCTNADESTSCLEPFVEELKDLVNCKNYTEAMRIKGFCRRFKVHYNGSESLPSELNKCIGIHEYVGEMKDCTECTAVYMLKREKQVSLVRLYTKNDEDGPRTGWWGAVVPKGRTGMKWDDLWRSQNRWIFFVDGPKCELNNIEECNSYVWLIQQPEDPFFRSEENTVYVICEREKVFGNWTNVGACIPSPLSDMCGQRNGTQQQNRTCKDEGNFESCSKSDTERNETCNATITCPSSTKISTATINVSGEMYSSTIVTDQHRPHTDQDDKTTVKMKTNQSNAFTSSRLSANGASSAIDEDETKSFGNNIEISIVFIFPSLSISVYLNLFNNFRIK